MVTIFFPDVSHYQAGLKIQPGTKAFVAKCTQGTTIFDPSYNDFKAQAERMGVFFVGYHWLNHGNIPGQVNWVHQHMGDTPLMLDCEDVSGNTGYSGPLTAQDIAAFVSRYRSMGGIVHLMYLPHWYWQGHMGSPDLSSLEHSDLHLVASEYRSYSDTAWPTGYGHMNPDEWQFTASASYGGQKVDMNAYRGTVEEFITLATGGSFMTWDPSTWKIDWPAGGPGAKKSMNDILLDMETFVQRGEGPEAGAIKAMFAAQTAALQSLTDLVTNLAHQSGAISDADRQLLFNVQTSLDAVAAHLK